MALLVPETPIEALARQDPLPPVGMSIEECDKVAALAYLIGRAVAERAQVPDLNFVPYEVRTANQRAASRSAVLRVIQALILLGWIEPPGAIVGA